MHGTACLHLEIESVALVLQKMVFHYPQIT